MNLGVQIAAGILLGIVAGIIGALGLTWTVKMLRDAGEAKGSAQFILVLVLLLKFPLMIGFGYISYRISATSLYAFTATVCILYGGLVVRAIQGKALPAARKTPDELPPPSL